MDNVRFRDALLQKILMVQFQQGRFAASADAGDDFDQVYISVLNELPHIFRAIDEFRHCCIPPWLFFYYTLEQHNVNSFELISRKLF